MSKLNTYQKNKTRTYSFHKWRTTDISSAKQEREDIDVKKPIK